MITFNSIFKNRIIITPSIEISKKQENEYNSKLSNFNQNSVFNMSSKIDDVASKVLIKSRSDFEEFEGLKHAQKSLNQEIDFVKKTIKNDTSNMLRLIQDFNELYKNTNRSKIYEEAHINFDSTTREELNMLKRKVDLINSKEHSLSQRLMSVEDRVLIALDKKPVTVMHHQGVEKHDFLALQTAVNELQETCRYEPAYVDKKIQINQNDIHTLKENQSLMEKELLGLKLLFKNETANTLKIMNDLNLKIKFNNKNSEEIKEYTSNDTENTSQSKLATFSSLKGIENEMNAANECTERIDRIAQDQDSLNNSLKRQVDALFQNEQKISDRLDWMAHKMKNKSLNDNKWNERLNQMDKFLLELTRIINDVVIKTSNKKDCDSEEKKVDQLSDLKGSFEKTLKTLKDVDVGLKNEKVDIEMLKKQIAALETYVSQTNAEQNSQELYTAIQDVKVEVNALSMAIKSMNNSKLTSVEDNMNKKPQIQNDEYQYKSNFVKENLSGVEYLTLASNITEISRKVENLIAAIDKIKQENKSEQEKKDQLSAIRSNIEPSKQRELDRNFYTHDGQNVNETYDGFNHTLNFELIDEIHKNMSPESPISANESKQVVSSFTFNR